MLEVLVGTYDLKKLTAFSFYYQVEKFDVHAEFAGQKKYDIAAVRVQGEIQYNDYVQPIALLKDSDIPKFSPVLFTGFGRLQVTENIGVGFSIDWPLVLNISRLPF